MQNDDKNQEQLQSNNENQQQTNEQQEQEQESQNKQDLTLSTNKNETQQKQQKLIELKVVVAGTVGVGKTSLLYRLQNDELLNAKSTTGAQYQKIIMSDSDASIQLHIFDTAGSEQFKSLAPMYFRKLNILILVFDVSRQQTIDECLYYYQLCQHSQQSQDWQCIVIANKMDLITDREEVQKQLEQLQDKIKCKSCYISCKSGEGIEQLLEIIKEQSLLVSQTIKEDDQQNYIEIRSSNRKQQQKCC